MNRTVRGTLFLILTLVSAGYGQSGRKSNSANSDALRACLREFREAYGIPGIAAVVLTSDSILDTSVDGIRIVGAPDSIEVDDMFHIGSNTKAMNRGR